jgi:hypothetical protein
MWMLSGRTSAGKPNFEKVNPKVTAKKLVDQLAASAGIDN